MRRLIRHRGAERVVFGSEWPMTCPAEELTALHGLGLTDDELECLLGGTLARVLRIDPTQPG